MNKKLAVFAAAFLALAGLAALAQEAAPERITVPLSSPGKPALVEIQILMGSVKVSGYDGKDVVVEAKPREKSLTGEDTEAGEAHLARQMAKIAEQAGRVAVWSEDERGQKEKQDRAAGLKKIPLNASGLTVEERDNHVSIALEFARRGYDLDVKVPAASSVKIGASATGSIRVENVSGEVEVGNVTGTITLISVAGPVTANTNNGDIEVVFSRVPADKPMSFATFNGDVDLTLPAESKASFKIKSQMGDVYSDFDMALKTAPARTEEGGKSSGRYRVSIERAVLGTINGGGAEFTIGTYNGSVYIRKKK